MSRCSECGEEFELVSRRGKPRKKCYKCSPARPNQLVKRKRTDSECVDSPHCPWCGAYPDTHSQVFPFCNPAHRRFFADRVAAAQDERRIRLAKGPMR